MWVWEGVEGMRRTATTRRDGLLVKRRWVPTRNTCFTAVTGLPAAVGWYRSLPITHRIIIWMEEGVKETHSSFGDQARRRSLFSSRLLLFVITGSLSATSSSSCFVIPFIAVSLLLVCKFVLQSKHCRYFKENLNTLLLFF